MGTELTECVLRLCECRVDARDAECERACAGFGLAVYGVLGVAKGVSYEYESAGVLLFVIAMVTMSGSPAKKAAWAGVTEM